MSYRLNFIGIAVALVFLAVIWVRGAMKTC
jgi:hypothetical protein